jgi:hypothetical protein
MRVAFQIPYVYDYIIKSCRQQAEVIQNNENENVFYNDKTKPDTGNPRKYLAAVMFTTVQVSRLPLWSELLVSSRA